MSLQAPPGNTRLLRANNVDSAILLVMDFVNMTQNKQRREFQKQYFMEVVLMILFKNFANLVFFQERRKISGKAKAREVVQDALSRLGIGDGDITLLSDALSTMGNLIIADYNQTLTTCPVDIQSAQVLHDFFSD